MEEMTKEGTIPETAAIWHGAKGFFIRFFLLVSAVAFTIAGCILLDIVQQTLYVKNDFLFYQTSDIAMLLVIVLFEFPFLGGFIRFCNKRHPNQEWGWVDDIFLFVKRFWYIAAICWLLLLYVAITEITVVTADQIIFHNWRYPRGITYAYSDVTKIKAGYSGKLLSIVDKQGTFSYQIHMGDRWIKFSCTTPNEEIARYEDSYLELEEFDTALMQYHPEKISSHKNERMAVLDQRYIDRFGRIIDNK